MAQRIPGYMNQRISGRSISARDSWD